GSARANFSDRAIALATFPARVAHKQLFGLLLAGDKDLLGVNHHDEITRIQVRRVNRLVLSAQNIGHLNREPPEHGTVGIDEVPLSLIDIDLRQIRFHPKALSRSGETTKEVPQVNSSLVVHGPTLRMR